MVKIKRGESVISVNVEDIQTDDLFMVVGTSHPLRCTTDALYDVDEDCYYVISGINSFHESMIENIA